MLLLLWIGALLFNFTLNNANSAFLPQTTKYCHNNKYHLRCYQHFESNKTFPTTIVTLELYNIDWDVVDMNILVQKFPNMENLSIENGQLQKFDISGRYENIKLLSLKNMSIESVSSRFVHHFPRLVTLNLKDNNLQTMKTNFSSGNLQNLFLAENKWNCSINLSWIFHINNEIITDIDNLTCYKGAHNNRNLLTIANFTKTMHDQCPLDCACNLFHVVAHPNGDRLEPMIEVNCSYRKLTHLPPTLPTDTKILRVEGNEISDVIELKANKYYKSVLEVYLDDNKVGTIEDLEGSYFLKHFRAFSLNGNRLSEIPTYALDNALAHNKNMPLAVRLNLGANPWRCDCVFTPVFKEMLQKFAPQITNIREIKCSYVEGDENSLLPIIELSRSSVCRLPTEYSLKALNLLNAVLASLIVLILGKLLYDYYYFKKTGRLPWIVTKMP